ncbi:iron-sulfur cluster biosynthesis transcriptional regulator SufR [Synechococcales cyanobacterium C]|uniref:Iron-sulfur cluster biosynthesis transcriptional regulator SufR n=1 Tax=Petrachloros mirabilis ULC683 TaxID=2781853 RepID=A0A8K1ZZ26_9CYAN|nr:iron-sulfur cluster biosynthesis transcriptional regulator SufR [Petrachloros mirabilis ULC683]
MTVGTSTKQDILNQLLKRGQASAQALAESLAVSSQAIRRHLKDLEAEGLIEFETVQAGMGRPQHLYQLSKEGRDRFPNRHDEFALDLLDTLAETVGPEQMRSILRKQWERKALEYQAQLGQGSLAERVTRLVALRRAEGYMAESYPLPEGVNSSEATGFILTEYNCAISHVAESFPSVCDHELEMFAIALPDCQVERTHWLVNGEHRCGYLIQPQKN